MLNQLFLRISFVGLSLLFVGCSHSNRNQDDNPNATPPESTPEATPAQIADWDPDSVPDISAPPNAEDWKPFYRNFDFSLAIQEYRNDPALAALVLQKYTTLPAVQWSEKNGTKQVNHNHVITEEQKKWIKDAFHLVRPAGVSYCQWLQKRAIADKDVRAAVTSTLLWLKLEQLQKPTTTKTDGGVDQVEHLKSIIEFLGKPGPAESISLLKSEIQGELGADSQWTIEDLTSTWQSSYNKSFGLSSLTVSPPQGMTFLRVKATITNSGSEIIDTWSLPLYQESPREFMLKSATDWWKPDVEMYPESPPQSAKPRRLLTKDMVQLITSQNAASDEIKTFLPAGVIPCHVVHDECEVLMGSMAGTMLMLMALSKKAVNPGLIASGSWVGQGTQVPLDVYFAVKKEDKFDYSLYIMGNAPIKIPAPH